MTKKRKYNKRKSESLNHKDRFFSKGEKVRKLQRHNDIGYIEDVRHLSKIGALGKSDTDWIETTMIGLREKTNIYEVEFANYLIDKKIKFIHQAPFIFCGRKFFADFYLPEYHTIVEIDGQYHDSHTQAAKDRFRDVCFDGHRIETIRIPNTAVKNEKILGYANH